MEYAKHEIKLFLSEIYPEEVLKDECLDFIEKSYNALSFWGIVDKQNKNLKTITTTQYSAVSHLYFCVKVTGLQDRKNDIGELNATSSYSY